MRWVWIIEQRELFGIVGWWKEENKCGVWGAAICCFSWPWTEGAKVQSGNSDANIAIGDFHGRRRCKLWDEARKRFCGAANSWIRGCWKRRIKERRWCWRLQSPTAIHIILSRWTFIWAKSRPIGSEFIPPRCSSWSQPATDFKRRSQTRTTSSKTRDQWISHLRRSTKTTRSKHLSAPTRSQSKHVNIKHWSECILLGHIE